MGRRLTAYVHVADEDGLSHAFGPGQDVPAWAEARITNPGVWAEGDADTAELESTTTTSEPDVPPAPDAPPRGGEGSGRDVWAAYAESVGVEVPEDATRDDIVALVDARE